MSKSKITISITPRQIWGIAVLMALLIIGVVTYRFWGDDQPAAPNEGIVDWQKNEQYEQKEGRINGENFNNNRQSKFDNQNEVQATKSGKLFTFDPNLATEENFIQLGIPPKVAKTIINYRNKGGKFYKPTDFGKIYTLSEADFKRLLPYIRISNSNDKEYQSKQGNYPQKNFNSYQPNNNYPTNYTKKLNKPVNVNSCTPTDLMTISGLGTGYSERIIKYRDILGGYASVEQLKEVNGMTDSLYEAIKPYMLIDQTQIKTIAVNDATEEDLKKHPYFRKIAKYVVAYRQEIGGFHQIEDFRQVPLINEEIYRKIVPYLNIQK